MKESKQKTPYPLRMPDELRGALERASETSGRSMNAELVNRLEQSFAVEEQARAFMSDDPLKGIVTLCEMMAGNVTSIASLALQAGIDSGQVKVKDEEKGE